MALSEIAQALVRRGVISRELAIAAEQRKKLYGGGLDTALLELHGVDEATLTSHLAELLGIPLASPEVATEQPNLAASAWMDETTAQRIGAAPRTREEDVLEVLVRPEHNHDALVAWAAERSLLVEPELVCEVRFRGFLRALYGIPVAPRYLGLLARLVGAPSARAVLRDGAAAEARTPNPVKLDRIDTLLAAARLGDPAARRTALRRLTEHVHDARVIAFRHALLKKAAQSDPGVAVGALAALADLRDRHTVPRVAELLEGSPPEVAAAAHRTLVTLTCDDVGRKPRHWLEWWARLGHRPRAEWLLEGLAHRTPEIRLLASSELHELSHEYFGYHHDLPERDREEARQRWIAWWKRQRAARPG